MAEPTDPIDPGGRVEDTQASEPSQWQRKHRPELEPPAKGEDTSSGASGWKVLGALGSIVLTVVGLCAGLSNRGQNDDGPPPPAVNFQGAKNLKELLDRQRSPAMAMEEVETQLVPVEKAVGRIQTIRNWTPKDFEKPETAELFAKLRRTLRDLQSQLAGLDPSRLTPEELTKRDQLAQRVENLHCTVVALTGRDE